MEDLLTAPFGSIRFDAYEHAAEEVAYFLEIGIEDALRTVRVLISNFSSDDHRVLVSLYLYETAPIMKTTTPLSEAF